MQAVLSDYLWVPRETVEAHHLAAFSYDLTDGYTNLPIRIDTFEEDRDCYRFPRGNLAKLQRIFPHHVDDRRTAAPHGYELRFTGSLYEEQKELVRAWLRHGYGMIQAPPRSGKCVVGSSLVVTDDGVVLVTELRPGMQVHSGSGLARVSAYHHREASTTIKMRTHCGYEIHGTPEHPVLTVDNQLTVRWLPLDQVVPGTHKVAVAWGTDTWASTPPMLPVIDPKVQYHTTNIYPTPRHLTAELARLLGYLVGEGSLAHQPCHITNTDPELLHDFRHCVRECFGADASGSTDKRNGVKNVGVSSVYLAAFLSGCGLQLAVSAGQVVPWCILRAPRDLVVQFLRAYFDADGTASKDNIETVSASEELIRQVQLLLLNLGVVSRRTVKQVASPHSGTVRPYYRLMLHGADIRRFHERIGFGLERKQTFRNRHRKHDRAAVLPFVGAALCALAKRGRSRRQLRLAKTVDHGRGDDTSAYEFAHDPDLIRRIAMIDKNMAVKIGGLLERGHFWDDVATVQDGGPQAVYDVTVPEHHSFVANGLVVHNTVVMTALMCKLKQRTLMLAHLEDLCHQLEETIRRFTNVNELEDRHERKLVGVLEEWDDFYPIATLSTYQCFAVSPRGRRVLQEHRDDFGLVMVDEVHRCFGPGTIVSGRAIETIRVGDTVQACDGQRVVDATVLNTMKSSVKTLLTIECESGRILAVTPNHPLWDGTQYRRADSFGPGDCLYGQTEDVRCMRHDLPAAQLEQQEQRRAVLEGMRAASTGRSRQTDDGSVRNMRETSTLQGQEATPYVIDGGASGKGNMLGSMSARPGAACIRTTDATFSGVSQPIQSRTCKRSDEGAKSDASRARPCGCIDQVETDGAQARCSGRQRSATERAATPAVRGAGVADGVRGADEDPEGQRLPHMLQDRHCRCVQEDRGRSGRGGAQLFESPSAGQEEGGVLAVDRVVRVAVHEQGGDGRFERLCPEGLVYNLTVEPHNNYFADGALVHNCKTELYREVVERTTAAYRCGVTATPVRKDGMHVVVHDTLGPVVAIGHGEQLPVHFTWEYTGVDVEPFANWSIMWNRLVKRKRRDKMIARKVVQDVNDGHYVLVTTERLQHLDDLKLAIQTIDPDVTVGLLSSRTKDREGFRSACKRGEYQVVIAMNKIVELGYNIPRWSCFHNVLPMANRQNWYQRISRIRTPMEPAFEGDDWVKPQPLARVWVDSGHPAVFAYKQIVKRENERLGFECLNPDRPRPKGKRKGLGFGTEGKE